MGLYYLQSRFYDAVVGRFVNADDSSMLLLSKCGLKGTNLFAYCDNNVVNNIDSEGNLWIINKAKGVWNKAKDVTSSAWNGIKVTTKSILKYGKSKFNSLKNWSKPKISKLIKNGNKEFNKLSRAGKDKFLKMVNYVNKNIKPIFGNTYRNFTRWFSSQDGWYGFFYESGLTLLYSNPVTAACNTLVIFIVFDYENAY